MGVTLTNEMITGAIKAQETYGVPASVTLAQILLESGGSNAGGLSDLAYYHNNLFGIKAGSNWSGGTVTYNTTEYANGKPYTTKSTFRSYNSVQDSINDHAILLNKPIYTNKTKNSTNLTEYVNAMGSVYATDPNYASKLLNIINSNNLTQYDNGKFPEGVTTSTVTNTTDNKDSWWDTLISNLVKYIAIVFLGVTAVVFFMGAFDIKIPTKKSILKGVTKNE